MRFTCIKVNRSLICDRCGARTDANIFIEIFGSNGETIKKKLDEKPEMTQVWQTFGTDKQTSLD